MSPRPKERIVGQVTHDVTTRRGRLVEALRMMKGAFVILQDLLGDDVFFDDVMPDIDTPESVDALLKGKERKATPP